MAISRSIREIRPTLEHCRLVCNGIFGGVQNLWERAFVFTIDYQEGAFS